MKGQTQRTWGPGTPVLLIKGIPIKVLKYFELVRVVMKYLIYKIIHTTYLLVILSFD